MDFVYDQAVKRLNELESEAIELRKFIELHRKARQLLGLERGPPGVDKSDVDVGDIPPPAEEVSRRRKVTDNPKPAIVVAESLRILGDRRSPMTRRELHEELTRRGLEVRGADPIKALGTMLWRAQDDIIQIDGHGYWIKKQPLPELGYEPDESSEEYDETLKFIG